MKKLITVMVIAILGMTTQSCADENFSEVEDAVLENQISDSIDVFEKYKYVQPSRGQRGREELF
ncbi:MAG: hypothetical protein GY816_17000 [Cytophagales bacterium]|nr:hypothetical protein [Cytophagales bacterium]